MADKGFTLWFTGLSGAGKTTISRLLEGHLRERGSTREEQEGRPDAHRLVEAADGLHDRGFARAIPQLQELSRHLHDRLLAFRQPAR